MITLDKLRFSLAPPKKRYHMVALREIERKLWETEFMKDRAEQLREDIRQNFDRLKERDMMNRRQLEAEEAKKNNADKKVCDHLRNLLAKAEPDMKAMQDQLANLDAQIGGENEHSFSMQMDVLKSAYDQRKWYIKNRL